MYPARSGIAMTRRDRIEWLLTAIHAVEDLVQPKLDARSKQNADGGGAPAHDEELQICMEELRVAAEESLVRELNARGMQAVATYRIAPKEELARADTAKPWFEKANVEGVVAVRPVSVDTETYTTGTWVTTNYSTLWGYYGYGWTTVYAPASARTQTVVVVETTIYSVPRNQLLWAAVSETNNPRDLRGFFEELSKEMVKEMQKQGLARRAP